MVLKTLSQALSDGDSIECVIRETGVNQDGRTTGITMPNHNAQEALIRATYAKAGLDITKAEERCQFFEAHGQYSTREAIDLNLTRVDRRNGNASRRSTRSRSHFHCFLWTRKNDKQH